MIGTTMLLANAALIAIAMILLAPQASAQGEMTSLTRGDTLDVSLSLASHSSLTRLSLSCAAPSTFPYHRCQDYSNVSLPFLLSSTYISSSPTTSGMTCSTVSYIGRKVNPTICYSRLEASATRITIAINPPCVSGLDVKKLVFINGRAYPYNVKFEVYPAGSAIKIFGLNVSAETFARSETAPEVCFNLAQSACPSRSSFFSPVSTYRTTP